MFVLLFPFALLRVVLLLSVLFLVLSLCLVLVRHAHLRMSSPVHGARCAQLFFRQGPTGRKGSKGKVPNPTEDVRLVRGGGKSKFSVGWPGTGAGCSALSRAASRTRHQVVQGWCGDTFYPPGGFLIPTSCHLGAGWASGHQWVGGRCVVHQGREPGAKRLIPEVVCCPPILTT